MEIADWIVIGFLLLISIFIYYMHENLNSVTRYQAITRVLLEKIEKKLEDLEKVLEQKKD